MFLQLYTFLQLGGYLPLITFLLGIILTFAVTSVNHKRIHRDDIRKTVFEAVFNTKKCASEYWHSKYDEKNYSDLIGSIVLFQHIMPLSEGMMNKKQQLEMQDILGDFVIALRGEDDMRQKKHKKDPARVAEIHTIGSFFLKQYYSIYLKQTNIITLTFYPRWIQIGNLYPLWIWLKSPDKNPQFKNGGA